MDHKGERASAAKLHFFRLLYHQSSCIRIYTFLRQYKNCSYVSVSTPLSRTVDLVHCADGFTFPLTCHSEKPSELNICLELCVCLPFYPGGGPRSLTEQRMVGLKPATLYWERFLCDYLSFPLSVFILLALDII